MWKRFGYLGLGWRFRKISGCCSGSMLQRSAWSDGTVGEGRSDSLSGVSDLPASLYNSNFCDASRYWSGRCSYSEVLADLFESCSLIGRLFALHCNRHRLFKPHAFRSDRRVCGRIYFAPSRFAGRRELPPRTAEEGCPGVSHEKRASLGVKVL